MRSPRASVPNARPSRLGNWLAAFSLATGLLGPPAAPAADSPKASGKAPAASSATPSVESVPLEVRQLTANLCGACHRMPPASILTRQEWRPAIQQMNGHMEDRELPVSPQQLEAITRYYETFAPEALPPFPDDFEPSGLNFDRQSVGHPRGENPPTVTNLLSTDLDQDGRADLVVCDADRDTVSWLRYTEAGWVEQPLASLVDPARTRVADFDGDGDLDIAVAVLGILYPTDELSGSAVLLRNDGPSGFTPITLASGLPRVADIEVADLDGDGDRDFLLAMFGWRKTGGLAWVETREEGFRLHPIQKLNGVMQLSPAGKRPDGRPAYYVLIAQQHEVMAELVDPAGEPTLSPLASAGHPAFGFSGFQITDLDGDGKPDMLLSNGDHMDAPGAAARPFHGVRWLPDLSEEASSLHKLLDLACCYRAVAVDLDGDGDQDVVASSLYPDWLSHDLPSLVWMENVGQLEFRKREIARDPSNLITFATGDFDGDGRLDIVAGGMHVEGPAKLRVERLTAWIQQERPPKPSGTTTGTNQPTP